VNPKVPTPENLARASRVVFTDTTRGQWRMGCVGSVRKVGCKWVHLIYLATGRPCRVPVERVESVLTFRRGKPAPVAEREV